MVHLWETSHTSVQQTSCGKTPTVSITSGNLWEIFHMVKKDEFNRSVHSTVGFTQNRDTVALVQNKMYVVCTKYIRRNTPTTASSRQPQTTNTRESWPKLADFATTISLSFLGQISCLRHGNPSRASAVGTHWTCFASLACSCSFLLGLFKASVKLANFVSGSQRWFLGPLHLNSPCT